MQFIDGCIKQLAPKNKVLWRVTILAFLAVLLISCSAAPTSEGDVTPITGGTPPMVTPEIIPTLVSQLTQALPQTGTTVEVPAVTPELTLPVTTLPPGAAQAALTCTPPADLTPSNTEGPYFKSGSPETNSLIEPGMIGTPLHLSGFVLNSDCQPISGAVIDFWQADATGVYDIGGFSLRGHQVTGADGSYSLETVLPGEYPGRPPHIHVKVQPPGGDILTTQLYFPDESANQRDSFFLPELVVAAQETSQGVVGQFTFIVSAP